MKKYNIFSLYVVKAEKNGVINRFIVKANMFNDLEYIEVLTGEKIPKSCCKEVVDLCDYYPPLTTRNYNTGRALHLNKNDLLRKYIDINTETIIEREDNVIDDDGIVDIDGILDRAVSELFPDEGCWGSDCFSRPDTLGVCYIPCHSRDDLWMAKLIRQNKKLFFISLDRILQYVKNSEFYKAKRHEYELEVVRWQINWMTSGGDNWLVSDEYSGDFIHFDTSCDMGFRDSVIRTLTKIGMDKDVVEEGIEVNADMWRDTWINMAFRNRFEPILGQVIYPLFGEDEHTPVKQIGPASDELREKWIRLRKYEYYRDHKDVVDKYGKTDSDMLMSESDAKTLQEEVRKLSIARQKEIEEFKKKREEDRQLQYQLKKTTHKK